MRDTCPYDMNMLLISRFYRFQFFLYSSDFLCFVLPCDDHFAADNATDIATDICPLQSKIFFNISGSFSIDFLFQKSQLPIEFSPDAIRKYTKTAIIRYKPDRIDSFIFLTFDSFFFLPKIKTNNIKLDIFEVEYEK